MIELSVVIPTARRPRSLDRLLASLESQDFPRESLEVIVAFNTREDEGVVRKRERSLPLRWSFTGQPGVNRARNHGIGQARGGIILLFDDDVELVDRSLLQTHLDLHNETPSLDGLGGGYTFPAYLSDVSFAYHLIAMSWLYRYADQDGTTPYLIGGHASYKSRIFQEGFRFDDQITFGGSETEFNLRLFQAGKILRYRPELSVLHHAEIGYRDLARKAFMQGFHSYRRKQQMQAPEPRMKFSLAVRTVAGREAEDRSGTIACRIATGLFDRSFELGWEEARLGRGKSLWRHWYKKAIGTKL